MTPDFYDEYLQHEMTQAEAKKVVDNYLATIGDQPISFDPHYQDLHRFDDARAVAAEFEANLFRVMGGMAPVENKPKIKLTDIKDFASG